MVGFGKGKIEIFIEKYQFSPGDTIKGKISMKLKKPVHARALKVGLIGEKWGPSSRGGSATYYVFKFEMPLDYEKDYLEGEYEFEIKIPVDILESAPGGLAGEVLKSYRFLSGMRTSWYVEAKLDIPSGLDVSKQVQVNIG
jgi:hypothetical protein